MSAPFAPLFFNVQHAPIGAFASFTLGAQGRTGGFGLELKQPADENILIGLENADGSGFACLPFFEPIEDDAARFDVMSATKKQANTLQRVAAAELSRELTPGRDTWRAGDLEFTIHTPVTAAPAPSAPRAEQMLAYVPALAVELVVDNRRGRKARRVIFGYEGGDARRGMRRLDEDPRRPFVGIAQGTTTAIASDSAGIYSGQAFTPESLLADLSPLDRCNGLGKVALLVGTVPAGQRRTYRYVVCFFQGAAATTGLAGRYHYTKYFADLEAVAAYGLKNFAALKARGNAFDRRVARSGLSPVRQFHLAHAIHSYFASTQYLTVAGKPFWNVNEGEYRMMNTFDLTVDQVFFELEFNPWTVANELDWFRTRYSYTDTVRFPGDAREYPGGLSFTHDMGVNNHFSRPAYSSYERGGLHGCFSYMTHEELVNWLVCGLLYENQTRNRAWLKASLPTFHRALESLLRRDHPDPAQRDGVMSLDSSRCDGGSEITTYDSLDVSLGQARNNLYLAVKCWGVYLGLEALFTRLDDPRRARLCAQQAARAAHTIVSAAEPDGLLPAILHENVASRIIPAIEGLIIPHRLGLLAELVADSPHRQLVRVLQTHLGAILRPGVCQFAEGGWKLSSTSDNSWLSKIYLCQAIAEQILGAAPDARADEDHARWLLDEQNHYWAWSDQMAAGRVCGSRYYPRGVTAILWLKR